MRVHATHARFGKGFVCNTVKEILILAGGVRRVVYSFPRGETVPPGLGHLASAHSSKLLAYVTAVSRLVAGGAVVLVIQRVGEVRAASRAFGQTSALPCPWAAPFRSRFMKEITSALSC